MRVESSDQLIVHNEAFSVATLLYTRLRRVSGRVIDALYLVDHPGYAKDVIELALATRDAELSRYAERLTKLLDLNVPLLNPLDEVIDEQVEPEITEEEIYRAQVSHHYIGALR
ncbi:MULTISPECIES: hypothetical protein [unclassified Acinetobacter]|uniref:hypothetical protein n=1 Tax=unclassified Acinetobacter TaxID=196816 RepID=UPI0015D43E0A|nr:MULTISPECIES: hypothetical protein [unclassified Acinetobacter]